MPNPSSQKFIKRNRPPRVQIEYDVDTGGAQAKVSIPFVTGVMADLAGKQELPPIDQRKFLEYDNENFNDRMKAINPKAAYRVKNVLSEEGGEMGVSIDFESMDCFNPDAVAEKVPAVNELLNARKQLQNLLARMDGKSDAEALLGNLLGNNEMLQKLADQLKAKQSESSTTEEGA